MRHSPSPSGQWLVSEEGTRWFFDSGAVSLDFAATAPSSAAGGDKLVNAADLGGWLAERFERVDAASATERDLADALRLRASIAAIATAVDTRHWAEADDIDTVNIYAATPDIPPALDGGQRQAGASRIRVGQALATIARDAVELFSRDDAGERVHSCSADDCDVIFFDDSRTANRRWCSMQRCGNRAKVRAHRARQREKTA